MLSESLYKRINKAKIVSFDIFDTLLLMPYMNRVDLFNHIGKIYSKSNFQKERINAEANFYTRNTSSKAPTIDDIYNAIPQYSELKDIELQMSYQIASLNQEMKKVYDYALSEGKTVILVSDIHLPYEFMEKILKKNGIENYHKLYLSNKLDKRKDSGNMYDYIIEDLKANPKDILHIGDNKESDYKQAKKHKLNAYLYKTVNSQFLDENKKFKDLYKSNGNSLGLSILLSVLAQSPDIEDYWVNFGFTYAGMVSYSFVKMIYDNAKKENLKDILFVARDGYLLEKVFNTFNKEFNTHYVYAPRILNYTSNLDYDPKLKAQPKIICSYFKQDTKGKSCEQYIKENIDLFRELARKEKEKANYKNYILRQVEGDNRIGVVDSVSGQLSAQKLIENESGLKTLGFYFLTLAGSTVSELEHYDLLNGTLRDKFIQDYKCDLIELIFSAPENPIITVADGKPVYKENISPDEKTRHLIYEKIEAGALSFVNTIKDRFADFDIYFEKQAIYDLMQMYIDNPTDKDIKAMYEVKKSPNADNSSYDPILSIDAPFWQVKKYKKLPWQSPLQRIYCIIVNPLSIKIKFFKYFKITLFPFLKRNIFQCCFMDNIGFYIGGGNHV